MPPAAPIDLVACHLLDREERLSLGVEAKHGFLRKLGVMEITEQICGLV